ncbi:MAG TPA: hypothetical protein VMV77_16365 [Bacteroidales bacterium]|nr:hypothetical protein [Bacteroidales bacterium]
MLPKDWEKKLVDMNVTKLRDKDLEGVDFGINPIHPRQRPEIQSQVIKDIIIGHPAVTFIARYLH